MGCPLLPGGMITKGNVPEEVQVQIRSPQLSPFDIKEQEWSF